MVLAAGPEALREDQRRGALDSIRGDHSRAALMAARKVTEKRAADAARQLLYHQRLSEWISRKTAENVM